MVFLNHFLGQVVEFTVKEWGSNGSVTMMSIGLTIDSCWLDRNRIPIIAGIAEGPLVIPMKIRYLSGTQHRLKLVIAEAHVSNRQNEYLIRCQSTMTLCNPLCNH